MVRAALVTALLALGCAAGEVRGAPEVGDAATHAWDPEIEQADDTLPEDPESLVPFEPLDLAEVPDPGPPDEDLTDLDESAYPFTWTAPDGGTAVTLTCTPQGHRDLPGFVAEFERRWAAVSRESALYARCGDTRGIQRLEAPLAALVAMYEATAHPRYAARLLTLVEALRAAAVRNGGGFRLKRIRETLGPAHRAGERCTRLDDGRSFCLGGCEREPAGLPQQPLADMYLAEPVLRGLRLILETAPCYLPVASGLRTRARRHWTFFRAALWSRWRATATATAEHQMHILARYGEAALQVCLRDPAGEGAACALARRNGAHLRGNLLPHPRVATARVWGSSQGGCDPRAPDWSCHTIGGACDGNPGEAAHDCRGPGAHPRATCWRTFCGLTDVSHANTVVGFAVDLHRHAAVAGAAAFTDGQLDALGSTLRDVIWCGNPAPAGPYAASVFIDGHTPCGVASPPGLGKRDQQRRALALGWFRLGRRDDTLLGPMVTHTDDLLRRNPTRDRASLAAHAELARAFAARVVPEGELLTAAGCARCTGM